MDASSLYRSLPTQGTPRGRELAERMARGHQLKGPLKDAFVEQLSTVPEQWLARLHEEDMVYVALAYDESLAGTELLPSYSASRLESEADKVPALRQAVEAEVDAEIDQTLQGSDDDFQRAMANHSRPAQIAERLSKTLDENNIGFQVRLMRDQMPLEHLQNEFGVGEYRDWEVGINGEERPEVELFNSLLTELNGEGIVSEGLVDPESDVLIVPYLIKRDKRISPVSEASYSQINGAMMDQHYGANYWLNRLITLDDEAVNVPAVKTGYHSVLLHETGHAMDYVAEKIPELNHRATVDALFKKDKERASKGESPFLTRRAMDNEREYFAEAVEAYLTKEGADSSRDHYKGANRHEMLKQHNPELYAYVDKLMRF